MKQYSRKIDENDLVKVRSDLEKINGELVQHLWVKGSEESYMALVKRKKGEFEAFLIRLARF